jgi:hypothetical protein
MLYGNPKESWCIFIVNHTITGTGKHSGLARQKLSANLYAGNLTLYDRV